MIVTEDLQNNTLYVLHHYFSTQKSWVTYPYYPSSADEKTFSYTGFANARNYLLYLLQTSTLEPTYILFLQLFLKTKWPDWLE